MKILHIIPARFPILGYGGTERVAYYLGKAQAKMGHEVTYLCKPDSHLDFAKTIPLPAKFTDLTPLVPPGTDIVQLYATPWYKLDFPFLVNVGGNGQPGEQFHPNTVFVSENHARRHNWTEFVYNGIDLAEYPLQAKKDDYALFLAKASWRVKNLAGAIRIAQSAHTLLRVAGGYAPFWKRRVKSHGEVGGKVKLNLLQNARVLLFPIIWEEPFGIAVIEALACGTPVVATPRGSMPEIITKECGFIGNSFEELVDGVEKAGQINPEECRQRVAENFTDIKMAEKYLKYYQSILSKGKLRDGFAKADDDADPEKKIYYKNYKK